LLQCHKQLYVYGGKVELFFNIVCHSCSRTGNFGIQQIENSAAPTVTNTPTYDHITVTNTPTYDHITVTNTPTYDHITLILQKIHWLSVGLCIHFNILLFTYKFINDMAPEYLCGVHYKVIPKTQLIQLYTIAGACVSAQLSDMVIAHLVLQPPHFRIGCQQILETHRLLKFCNLY